MQLLMSRALPVCTLLLFLAVAAHAQTPASPSRTTTGALPSTTTNDEARAVPASDETRAAPATVATAPATNTTANETPNVIPDVTPAVTNAADDVRRQLRTQREEIERLQAALREQMRLIEELRTRVERTEAATTSLAAANAATGNRAANANTTNVAATGNAATGNAATSSVAPSMQPAVFNDTLDGARTADAPTDASRSGRAASRGAQDATLDERLRKLEEQAKRTGETITRQLGAISFSGDIRFRWEPTYGQQNATPSDSNPAALGNALTPRHRFRIRARFAARGQISNEFEWGLRLATGSFPDVNSSNQTLTDFFSHKNFALEQAYVTYKPAKLPGLQVQAGKFEVPWLRTEMTIDNDINPEGLNQSYTRNFKGSAFKSLTLVAWQLPFLERNSAFVLGADGRVNLEQSRRGGRDLALYGAQARVRFEPTAKTALTLSAADLYFSGTQFITPAQFFGANVTLPVTFTIPATATSPAQTITTQVSIPRDQLVTGNANLGVSTASNNAVNRDGRLSSGFNLVDLIARLDFSHSRRWPVMLLLNVVTNTQAHDVVAAGAGGASFLRDNDENRGYWAELQVGKTQQRGDALFNYTFMRIEKDAVLTPFNFSDIAQQSDVRAHRFTAVYAVDPRVLLSFTGLVSERPNGVLGVFGATPPGSLNRPTTRLQIDTIFRF